MKLNSKIREQKGSITLFVLLSILFFVIVLVGLYVGSSYKVQKQQSEVEKIQQSYERDNIDDLYEQTYQKFENEYIKFFIGTGEFTVRKGTTWEEWKEEQGREKGYSNIDGFIVLKTNEPNYYAVTLNKNIVKYNEQIQNVKYELLLYGATTEPGRGDEIDIDDNEPL